MHVEARERALVACELALVDYEAGLLDDDELGRILVGAGVVVDESGPWLLVRLHRLLDDLRHGNQEDPSNNEGGA